MTACSERAGSAAAVCSLGKALHSKQARCQAFQAEDELFAPVLLQLKGVWKTMQKVAWRRTQELCTRHKCLTTLWANLSSKGNAVHGRQHSPAHQPVREPPEPS